MTSCDDSQDTIGQDTITEMYALNIDGYIIKSIFSLFFLHPIQLLDRDILGIVSPEDSVKSLTTLHTP